MKVRLEQSTRTAWVSTFSSRREEAQPTVVFVHGAAMDHTVWTPFARHFARLGFAVLAPDLPGHGRSEGPPLARVEALAGWLGELLATLQVPTAALVGHSLGSLAVLELAGRQPALCSRLILVGTAVPMPVADGLLAAARANDHAALDMINIWGHSPRGQLGRAGAPGTWMLGAQLRLTERAAPGVLFADLSACNDYQGGLDAAARVQAPATLVLGARDAMTPPRAAAALARALPESETVTLGGGHALMAEQPNELLDALRRSLGARGP